MRVLTVIGPAHSGKSTLTAALAALDGRSTSLEIGDAVSVTTFDYLGDGWAAIDIAGGADALAHAGPALAASDAVVLCVPPAEDAAVLSAPYLRLIEEASVPCWLFINRMDQATDRMRDIVAALQTYSGHHIVLRQVPIREGETITGSVDLISERAWKYREGEPSDLIELPEDIQGREQEARADLLESLSDFDDALLEQLIEDKRPVPEDVYPLTAQVAEGSDLISAFVGAASHNNGVTRLMKSLRHEAPRVEVARTRIGGEGALAISPISDIRKHLGKLTLLRALGDGVAPAARVGGDTIGSLTQIDAKTSVSALKPGEIALAIKSDHLSVGRLYTADGDADLPHALLTPVHERDEVRLSAALQKLAQIDPGITLAQDATSGKAILSVQGPQHMRRVTQKLEADFGLEVAEAPVPPQYRETITKPVDHHHRHRKQSGGAGQFADVQITLKPAARGSGFAFDEVVKGGAVPRNYIPAVEHGAEDACAKGPHGFPVVDVSVTLTDGKSHSVDSSDFAFRTGGA